MTDRELLELAAKAAGIFRDALDSEWYDPHGYVRPDWNALTDDGDALRLAVKLGICVEFGTCQDDSPVVYAGPVSQRRNWPRYSMAPDFAAATRRAIVRAAAALGQNLAATREKQAQQCKCDGVPGFHLLDCTELSATKP